MNKRWTEEEMDFLKDNWGNKSIKNIALKLNRTINAVKIKAYKLELGTFLMCGDYVTVHQLSMVLGIDYKRFKKIIVEHNAKFYFTKTINQKVMVIKLDDFWKFAEKNKSLLDFSKFPKNELGIEPNWAIEKRKLDILAKKNKSQKEWYASDVNLLKTLLNMNKYTYIELAERFQRTEPSIKRKIYDLGLSGLVVRSKAKLWSDEEIDRLLDMHQMGYGMETIAKQLGRSSLSCRAKLEYLVKKQAS